MWTRIKYGGNDGFVSNHSVFICDTEDDIKTLPTDKVISNINNDKRTCSIGSTARVSDVGKKFFLNSKSEWEEFKDKVSIDISDLNVATSDDTKSYLGI